MTPYSWTCLACDEANAAQRLTCSRCGCPARATSAQVDSARDAWRRLKGLAPPARVDPLALVKQLPLLLIGAAVFLLLGMIALIVGSNVSIFAFGGLMIALAALCASSHWNDALA